MNNKKKKIAVGFISLGCPKNSVDSERMLAQIVEAGFIITAEHNTADIIIINTCGFIAPAKKESIRAIKNAVKHKRSGTVKKVIVAGCLPQREGRHLLDQVDGIDAVIGLGHRDNIVEIINKTLASKKSLAYLNNTNTSNSIYDDRTRLLITPGHWAYLRISEGCNRRCSFCTIPSIRGPFRSKPLELVISEAQELISAGVVELNIIAQDSTAYGRDLKTKIDLAELLCELEKIDDLSWIRLMYLYPTDIDDKLIEVVANSKKIVHYMDIPIQHINNDILRDMRRPDAKDHIERLIEKLSSVMPDIVLRTTLIVGFPGETDKQFAELLEFAKWAQFDALGAFTYYAESGTPAAQMPDQISEKIKQQRFEELMLTQQNIAFTKNENRIGTNLTCLVDAIDSEHTAQGRFYGQAPDIDSICIIKNCRSYTGDFIDVKVTGTKDYDLITEQI
ncbi:MAG: 30S ribosomal protein S12 methylthiotransferase RimO [Sedimentisphaerales bacterium]|nr:30S ribosomal protein S12 methylthiotransferase RimO [Sedimentisphaerales bacterium]